MGAGIRGIDHPVIAIRDMTDGHDRYRRLGFTIPPRGSHLEWGTGNWCIMFRDDYLELRGIVDPQRYLHHLDEFLAVREGLMGVAFNVANAVAAFDDAKVAGVAPKPPRELTRRFELAEGHTFPSFRLVFLEPQDAPGLMGALMIEHLTPELLRAPAYLDHPNGATSVASMTAVVPDPQAARAAYVRLFGSAAVAGDGAALTVDAGNGGTVHVVDPTEAERRGVALPGVAAPYLSAVAIAVSDLSRTRAVLADERVPFDAVPGGGIRVGPAETCGIVLDFVEAH